MTLPDGRVLAQVYQHHSRLQQGREREGNRGGAAGGSQAGLQLSNEAMQQELLDAEATMQVQ